MHCWGLSPFFRHWALELETHETEPQRDKELVEKWVVETTQWNLLHQLHLKKSQELLCYSPCPPSFLVSSPIFCFPSSWHPSPTPWTVVHIHKHSCTCIYKCWPHNFQRFGHSVNLPFLFFPLCFTSSWQMVREKIMKLLNEFIIQHSLPAFLSNSGNAKRP